MKSVLFYFSGTGNCLKVARDLAGELGDCEIVSIPKVINQELDLSAQRIGIIYPVYIFGMPLIVSRFISKLKPAQDKYIFAIATCGGKAGNSLKQTARELKSQNLELKAGFIITMPGNYTPLYGAIGQAKQDKMFEREKSRIKEIAQIVSQDALHRIEKDAILVSWLFSGFFKSLLLKIPFMDRDFRADEKCNSCGVCVKVCPVKNVRLSEGKPVWLHRCEQCMACLQWCPQEAIQYSKKTLARKRYRNPEVKLSDFILE